jgi:FkbM family methyltransferase
MLGETIRYKGVTYYINDYLSLLILSPFYERQVFLCLFKEIKRLLHLKDQIVMVDLGAHIGKYTVYFAKLFKSLRIIAVEPAPTNFIMLRKAIEANHLENVTPLRIACTDIDGETQLYISFKSGVHSLVKRSGAVTSIMVKGQSLDNLVGELRLESVDIIKIDVEGAEYKVLKGGLNTIRKHKPVILIEIWPSNHKTVVEFLRKLDYDVTSIEGANYIAKPTSR